MTFYSEILDKKAPTHNAEKGSCSKSDTENAEYLRFPWRPFVLRLFQIRG